MPMNNSNNKSRTSQRDFRPCRKDLFDTPSSPQQTVEYSGKVRDKLIIFSLLASGLLLIVTVLIIFYFFIGKDQYDLQGTNLVVLRDVIPIDMNKENINLIEQRFVATNDNLGSIYIVVKNEQQENYIDLKIFSQPENSMVTEKRVAVPVSDSYQNIYWPFNPINNSKEKKYSVIIDPLESKNLQFFKINKDRYPDGQLYINGIEQGESLVFSFQYQSNKLYKILLDRLPVYKPWFFKYYWSLIILLVVHILSITILVYFLIKNADIYKID